MQNSSSLPSEYLDELNALNKEVREAQPKDVIQFCADYFNKRLQEHRHDVLQNQNQNHNPSQQLSEPAVSFHKFNMSSFGGNDDPHGPNGKNSPKSGSTVEQDSKLHIDDTNPLQSQQQQQQQQSKSQFPPTGEEAHNFPLNFNANRRTSVSAESITPTMISEASVSQVKPENELTKEQLDRLNKSVAQMFLFKKLDEEALHLVLHSLSEKRVAKNEVIIKEGDEGDYFYIVESGEVQYSKDGKVLGQSGALSSFGELALMYNAPRAATVTALDDCVLWALDRITFRKILLQKTATKRAMYEEFLREVPVLKVLNQWQLSKLADALHSVTYESGQKVVVEGETGEEFYIIEDGTAKVWRDDSGEVAKLKKGDYFGEVALLNDQPRAATVIAESKLKVVALGKSAFQRLLGKVVDTLIAQDPTQ